MIELERKSSQQPVEVLTPREFLLDVVKAINQAQRRVMIQSMTFEADHVNLPIIQALKTANDRGVSVSVKVDAFVNMMTADKLNYLINNPAAEQRGMRSKHEPSLLNEAGSHPSSFLDWQHTFLPPSSFPARLLSIGRSHRTRTLHPRALS